MSECDAALGTIRTALRVSYAEIGTYPTYTGPVTEATGIDVATMDLEGTYFKSNQYTLVSSGGDTTYTITCTNDTILAVPRTLDQDGIFGGGPQ